MNTLGSYIKEGLFSSDSIDNQIDKPIENVIINKFREVYCQNKYLKLLESTFKYRYDSNNSNLFVKINPVNPLTISPEAIYNLDFNVCFEGKIDSDIDLSLNIKKERTDNIYQEKLNKSIEYLIFNYINILDNWSYNSNIYPIKDLNFNIGTKPRVMCEISSILPILAFENLNITMMNKCSLRIGLSDISIINNLNFSNKSAKCNKLILNIYDPKGNIDFKRKSKKLNELCNCFSKIEINTYTRDIDYTTKNISKTIIFNKNTGFEL